MLSVHSDGLIRANEEFAAWLKGERTQPFGQTQEHTTVRLTGMSRLLWHALGAKTIELIHQNVHVEIIRDDLDEIVLDAELLEVVLNIPDPREKAKEIQIKVARRLRNYIDNPQFKALSNTWKILRTT